MEQPNSSAPPYRPRKELVQVFFAIVLTQIAAYAISLVRLTMISGWSSDVTLCVTHLALCFSIVTASWYGWQMSVSNDVFRAKASVFQGSYILAIIDVLLVSIYYAIVQLTPIDNVGLFWSKDAPALRPTSSSLLMTSVAMSAMFGFYLFWDLLSEAMKEFAEKRKRPWPSLLCLLLPLMVLFISQSSVGKSPASILMYVSLIGLVFFFRAMKQLQKSYGSGQDAEPVPRARKCAIVTCVVFMAFFALSLFASKWT